MGDNADVEALDRELAALRERNRDLTDFIENASLALHWVDVDGRILWANQAELDLLGYSREEYIGRHVGDFHADTATIQEILSRLSLGETLRNYEARLRCKDGSIRHVLISSNVRWDNGQFLHTRCFTRDISDRKQHEQRLFTQYSVGRVLASAGSLQEAASGVLEVIATRLDWRAGLFWILQEDEQVLRCAAGWEAPEVEGFTANCQAFTFSNGIGLPGRVWSTKTAAWISDLEKDGNFPRVNLARTFGLNSAFAFPLMLGQRLYGVFEFLARDTRAADADLLEMAASVSYQMGEFLERYRAQQQLADREESYRVLTETASDGIVTIDAGSTILFANSAAARIFGYTVEELIGSDLTSLMPAHQRAAHKAGFARYLETGRRSHSWQAIRFAGVHRDGYDIPTEISIGEYRQRGGRFFVGIIRDITERNRLDETVRQSAKLESLGVLAGGIAHDFNNLLTGILGNCSLALDTLSDTETTRKIIEDAIEASERAANLTRQLLAYAGKGRFLIELIDLSALVREISTLIRSSIPKHVTLRLDLRDPIPSIEADVAQLQQLIMNLVINGAEAIPEPRQGTVLVITRVQEVDAAFLADFGETDIPPGQYVVLSVHDNGKGMDETTLTRIFDPFFTTKFTGRGLGLAAAAGIVRGHKGALKVFSSLGQGTTFKVLLPVSRVVKDKPLETCVRTDLAGRGLVLVVDDEPIVRKIATTSLETYGYSVVAAENGLEGVERFRELHPQVKIVILDMTMPVMSGEEALEHMRRISSSVPVILSSGYNEVEAIRRFSGKGLAGFLQKPYTAAALAEKVQTVLRETSEQVAPGGAG